MYGTNEKNLFALQAAKGLLKKSLLLRFCPGCFSAMQFAALFVVIGALVSDNRDESIIWISLGIMAVSLIGRIIDLFFHDGANGNRLLHGGGKAYPHWRSAALCPDGLLQQRIVSGTLPPLSQQHGRCRELGSCPGVCTGRIFPRWLLSLSALIFDWRIGLVLLSVSFFILQRRNWPSASLRL